MASAPTRTFTKGDLARHQIGGPVMMVAQVSNDLAYCIWFSAECKLCSGTFLLEHLENVDHERRVPVVPAAS